MTITEMETSDKTMLTPGDVAGVLGCNPYAINVQAKQDPARRWYVCDPVKNTECDKTCCMHNPEAECWACDMTEHKECAVLDEHGAPMEVDVRKGVSYPVFRSTPELCRADC